MLVKRSHVGNSVGEAVGGAGQLWLWNLGAVDLDLDGGVMVAFDSGAGGSMIAKLYSLVSGCEVPVAVLELPPFRTPPSSIVWGARVFRLDQPLTHAVVARPVWRYVEETFAYWAPPQIRGAE